MEKRVYGHLEKSLSFRPAEGIVVDPHYRTSEEDPAQDTDQPKTLTRELIR
jgi:hypothetical protein